MKQIEMAVCGLLLFTLSACSTVPPEPQVNGITKEELAEYTVILEADAPKNVQTVAASLGAYFTERFGITVPQYSDRDKDESGNPVIGSYEILIGSTGRDESKQFIDSLRKNDYGWQMIGDKLVIAGKTDTLTCRAVKKFMSRIKDEADTAVVYDGESKRTNGTYPIDNLTLGGVSVRQFCIVKKTGGMSVEERYAVNLYAEELQMQIFKASGYELQMSAAEEKYKLYLSKDETLSYGDSVIRFKDGNVRIAAGSLEAMHQALAHFSAAFADVRADAVDIPAETVELNLQSREEDSAMSYNIWFGGTDNAKQKPVAYMVLKYLPDTVGFQEASPAWMEFLTRNLSPVYAWVGEGRDGGTNGEYCPIFYKRSLYTLLDSGTKWMSDTPDTVSKVAESSLNRIFTYALLERTDGNRIMVVNTHLEHTSSGAREKQAAVLADFLRTVEYPILLTGDFNAAVGTHEYLTITQAGVENAQDIAERNDDYSATFTNFGTSYAVIDFIFTAGLDVHSHDVKTEKWNGEYPSDHNPVVIRYTVGDAAKKPQSIAP